MRASIWLSLSVSLMAGSAFAQDNASWEGKWIGTLVVDKSISDQGCGDGGNVELTVSGAVISGKANMAQSVTSITGKVLSPDLASIDTYEWGFRGVKLSRVEKEITARVEGRRCKSDWKLNKVN